MQPCVRIALSQSTALPPARVQGGILKRPAGSAPATPHSAPAKMQQAAGKRATPTMRPASARVTPRSATRAKAELFF